MHVLPPSRLRTFWLGVIVVAALGGVGVPGVVAPARADTTQSLGQGASTGADAFASRAAMSGTSASGTAISTAASKEPGEPAHAGNAGGKSEWWSWTAPFTGQVTVDTIGSDFDTLLGVYTGSAVSALTTIASDNNSGTPAGASKRTFNAIAGTTYQIAVDGFNGASGNITLNVGYSYTFTTLAGDAGYGSSDGTGSAARFNSPVGVAVDGNGNVFVADCNNQTIRKIAADGVVTTIAGMVGITGSADGTGSAARFYYPRGLAVDGSGNVFVADTGNQTIRRITAGGVVTTIAGMAGIIGSADGAGSAARFHDPYGVTVDNNGNLFVADSNNHSIRKITAGGGVTTFAGAGIIGGADGTGSAARFNYPRSVVVDGSGNVFVADTANQTIRRITVGGVVTTIAGMAGITGSADGTGSAARFDYPDGVVVDSNGILFVADSNNRTIRKITAGGVVTRFAGMTGVAGVADGPDGVAQFYGPFGVCVDNGGNVLVADAFSHTIRKITTGVVVSTVAGTAAIGGSADGTGGLARFNGPYGVAVDAGGNVFVADTVNETIRKITAGGVVTRFAGTTGVSGSADGAGSAAQFHDPLGVSVDGSGNVFVADTFNHTIRKITTSGVVSTVAGMPGTVGSADGAGSAARFNSPYGGVAVDSAGNVFVADTGNHTIRKITAGGVVTTIAGMPGIGGGVDGTGSAAQFFYPHGIAVDGSGNVFVADTFNHTIRKITVGGLVTTIAGSPGSPGSADGVGGAARFNSPFGVGVDSAGNVFVADSNNFAIRKITVGGVVTTIAGLSGSAFSVDGTGSAARFSSPNGIAVDGSGSVVVADTGSNTIRKGVPSYAAAPAILAQPVAQPGEVGGAATIAVVAAGRGPLSYQWRFNGTPISDGSKYSGTGTATLTVANVQMLDAGSYDVVVLDESSGVSTTSAPAVLSVAPTEYPRVMRLDPAFAPLIEANGGTVSALARQADGKFLVGGLFSRINGVARRNFARLNSDGSVDTGFAPGAGPDAAVSKILLQPDGKVLLGGYFTTYDGVSRGHIARANADGSLDASFAPGAGTADPSMPPPFGDGGSVASLALQSDGKILLGGWFSTYDGTGRSHIARVNADGSLDPTFDPGSGASSGVKDLTLRPDGKIVAVGFFAQYAGTPRNGVVRLQPDGSLDPTFVPVTGSGFEAYAVALQPDGKVLVGAESFSSPAPNLLRLNADGSSDNTFNSIPLRGVQAIALQGDGAIVVGGAFGTYNGAPRNEVARLTASGALDPTFDSAAGPDFQVNALVLQPNGQPVVGGRFLEVESSSHSAIARLKTTGVLDATFAGDVRSPGQVEALVRQSDGKFLIGGIFDYVNGMSRKRIARVNADGSLDTAFTPAATLANGVVGAQVSVDVFVVQGDGRILVGGFFDRVNGIVRRHVARLLVDGSVDPTFDPGSGANSEVHAIALQSDGKILLGGLFSSYAGTARNSIARVNANGSLDLSFDPGAGANNIVFSIAALPDGRALLGGWFSTYDGVTRHGMARILADGSLDPAFGGVNGFESMAEKFVTDSAGRIYVGAYNRITRLNPDGSVDSDYVSADLVNVGMIGSITRQADGRLLVGQATNSSANVPTVGIARVNPDGSRDDSFGVLGLKTAHFGEICLLDDGNLVVAGATFSDGIVTQSGLARFRHVNVATITAQPADVTVVAGGAATLSVAVTGDGPFTYQWKKDGAALVGATNAALTIASVLSSAGGVYTVAITNAAGTTVSEPHSLTVLPPVVPSITTQPRSQAVSQGAGFTLGVGVAGSPPLALQWFMDGVAIEGATGTNYSVAAAQNSDAGVYTLRVTNLGGSATSSEATVSVIPAGFSATHAVVGLGYVAGGSVTITNSLTYAGSVSKVGWQVLLPAGWSYAAGSGAASDVKPQAGDTGFLEWTWNTPPPSPVTFDYTLNVPANTTGPRLIAALMLPEQSGVQYTMLVKPDPLPVTDANHHSADMDHDLKLNLTELLRVIELYNTRNGTVRTGAYVVDPANPEDGFATDPARNIAAVVTLPYYHTADTGNGVTPGSPPDGKLQLTELLRVIELYNYRSGTVRTGEYHVASGTEDGFAPGP